MLKKGEFMKLWTQLGLLFSVATSTSLSVAMAQALQFGELKIAGNACDAETGVQELVKVEDSEIRYLIPLSLYLRKDQGKSLARANCTFSLPVKAAAGMKVIAANSAQLISLRAAANSNLKVELELFKSGSSNEKVNMELVTEDHSDVAADILRKPDLIAQSECGGQMILRGNLSTVMRGQGSSRVYARDLELDILAVPCDQFILVRVNYLTIQSEVYFIVQRSQGAGGQHVNRTNSAVTLKWHYLESAGLNEEEKNIITHKLKNRINDENELYLRSEVHRDQHMNRKESLEKLESLLLAALHKPKKRIPSRPTRSSVKKRVDSKTKHGAKKKDRSARWDQETLHRIVSDSPIAGTFQKPAQEL